jgi:hypothetical protein
VLVSLAFNAAGELTEGKEGRKEGRMAEWVAGESGDGEAAMHAVPR